LPNPLHHWPLLTDNSLAVYFIPSLPDLLSIECDACGWLTCQVLFFP
ncbi:hypothetical protein BAE44_0019149, partial [Dichanthelium oligosanthes]